MKPRYYFLLFLIGLLIRIAVASLQNSPGFMDAEYYFMGGRHLVQGDGFSEQILWNYLDDPTEIPHPSHGYWMPLTSILASVGMFITGNHSFGAAQIVFILVASLFPPLTAYLSYQLTQNQRSAILAGGLAILPAFYLPYLTTTDTFGVYAVLGVLFFILLADSWASKRLLTPILLGLISGLMHLSRADGVIWLGFAIICALFYLPQRNKQNRRHIQAIIEGCILVLLGYLTIMGPWFLRNMQAFGTAMAPGGSRSFWIIHYNELFIYPGSLLTPQRWLASGLNTIFESRLWAFKINLQRSMAEQGLIFLTPLILIGLWKFRKDFRIQLGVFIWLCTFAVMTLIFPYQGARGGFFHSSAALLSILWTAAAIGLNAILEWAGRKRGWNTNEAGLVFTIAIIFMAGALSGFVLFTNLFSGNSTPSNWEENRITYQHFEAAILEFGNPPHEIVMTTNPPGYFAHTKRSAIAIPDGEIPMLLEVAERYNAKILILEKDHPNGLDDLYANPETHPGGLEFLTTTEGTHIFIIK